MGRHVDLMQVDEDQARRQRAQSSSCAEQFAARLDSRGVEVGPGSPASVHLSKMLGQPSAFGAVIGSCSVKSNLSRALNGMLRRLRCGDTSPLGQDSSRVARRRASARAAPGRSAACRAARGATGPARGSTRVGSSTPSSSRSRPGTAGEDGGPDGVAVAKDRLERAPHARVRQLGKIGRDLLPQEVVAERVDEEDKQRRLGFRHGSLALASALIRRAAGKREIRSGQSVCGRGFCSIAGARHGPVDWPVLGVERAEVMHDVRPAVTRLAADLGALPQFSADGLVVLQDRQARAREGMSPGCTSSPFSRS